MHSPEIGAVLHEFESHMRFAVASFPHRHDFGLDGFAAVLVHQLYFLPNNDRLFQEAQATTLAHSLRPGFDSKYIARRRLPTQRQRYGDRYTNCAAALFKSKVQQGHIFTLDRRSGESCFSVNEAIFSETRTTSPRRSGRGGPINERQLDAQLSDPQLLHQLLTLLQHFLGDNSQSVPYKHIRAGGHSRDFPKCIPLIG
jgi:hypothetical protein